MAAPVLTSTDLLHLLPSQPSASSFVSFLKPLLVSSPYVICTRLRHLHIQPLPKTLFPSVSYLPTFPSCSSSSSLHATFPAAAVGALAETSEEDDSDYDSIEEYGEEAEVEEDELETKRGTFSVTQTGLESDSASSSPLDKRDERLKLEVPSLTVKERKELASYAHSLGKKLKTQLVGKSGVTSNVATSFIETLEANELLKIKIHRSCPGELDDVVKQLEEATGSVAVGQIGRTLIIYRPSLSKLKAEEKKKRIRELFLKRQQNLRLLNESKRQSPKLSRRGSSWKARSLR